MQSNLELIEELQVIKHETSTLKVYAFVLAALVLGYAGGRLYPTAAPADVYQISMPSPTPDTVAAPARTTPQSFVN